MFSATPKITVAELKQLLSHYDDDYEIELSPTGLRKLIPAYSPQNDEAEDYSINVYEQPSND